MVTVELNGEVVPVDSPAALALLLDEVDARPACELLLWVDGDGPLLFMLRRGEHAFLTYLREPGDSGFCSVGDADREGMAEYTLGNGQVDSYPLAWCVEPDIGYRALAYFYLNNGARPEFVRWDEEEVY